MKHNKKHDNVRSDGPHLEPVHLEFTYPTATAVAEAGTFNDWHPDTKSLHPLGKGHWQKKAALASGTYE